MSNPELISNTLDKLVSMGISIMIDDFRKGYTSLSQLSALPIHGIKIDKSFVTDMIDNVNNSAIVHSVIELAHNLGIKVIAEGVETKEVADKLLSMNCDRLQGYYIGSPTEPDKVTQSMQDNILNNFSS
jgi:EAL domain-containing protein (putative c-di-GMP-specific phosphodiesterase class I)